MTTKQLFAKLEVEFYRAKRITKIAIKNNDNESTRYFEGKANAFGRVLDILALSK